MLNSQHFYDGNTMLTNHIFYEHNLEKLINVHAKMLQNIAVPHLTEKKVPITLTRVLFFFFFT